MRTKMHAFIYRCARTHTHIYICVCVYRLKKLKLYLLHRR